MALAEKRAREGGRAGMHVGGGEAKRGRVGGEKGGRI